MNKYLEIVYEIFFQLFKKSIYKKIKFSQYFDQDWYRFVYELEIVDHNDYLLDYFQHGIAKGRDPSPYFNTILFNRSHKSIPNLSLYQYLNSGAEITGGAYSGERALLKVQEAYKKKAITSFACKNHDLQRSFGVFLQSGSGTIWDKKEIDENRNWDLIINHYDSSFVNKIPCDIEFHQIGPLPGTKFTAFNDILENYSSYIDQYEYIALLDDDITIEPNDISSLFSIISEHKWEMAQASLSSPSNCAYPVFYNAGTGFRYVNGVEIMMPVFSRRIFQEVKELIGQSISGWGFDTALAMVAQENGWRAAVVDDIIAHHLKPVNADIGGYYQMLHKEGIFPEIEFSHLQKKFRFRQPLFFEL